jgi:hypothetical protein
MVGREAALVDMTQELPLKQNSARRIMKLWWSEEVIGSGNILGFLFGDRDETIKVAELMIGKMKQSGTLSISRRQFRFLAQDLDSGRLGVKYSYHNFYTKLVRKLIDLGFLERCMIWDAKRGTTVRVYQLKIQPITDRPPISGFVKQAWQVAKGWNDLVQQ